MKNYLKSWTIIRFLRLVIGVVVIVQGVQLGQWMLVAVGVLFSVMPLFNVSMCGAGGCSMPTPRRAKYDTEDVTYEEIK